MRNTPMKYIATEKQIGETPLEATERARIANNIPPTTPLAYAGRLDPMASGKLLILVGDECKVQEKYHHLDKEYEFEVLLGIDSDTHDVLGITSLHMPVHPSKHDMRPILKSLTGTITLPYPHFSAKTVKGKPLHMWTLENRLHEIEIPTKTTEVYALALTGMRTIDTATLVSVVKEKIARVPEVTDPRKALGEDFRRVEVLAGWERILREQPHEHFTILSLTCVASSGTYMRTLASVIGEKLGTKALAYSIHRTKIGNYLSLPFGCGLFVRSF